MRALVERACEMSLEHVEVNTNGITLAQRDEYAKRLADAGVTVISLQFDGLTPETYESIRGVDLVDVKHAALEAGLSVLLVPTIVPGTNDDEMGDIVEFAFENLNVVGSINFQAVAHFGRYAENDRRFWLDVAARRLADQIEAFELRNFLRPVLFILLPDEHVLSGMEGQLGRGVQRCFRDEGIDVVTRNEFERVSGGRDGGSAALDFLEDGYRRC